MLTLTSQANRLLSFEEAFTTRKLMTIIVQYGSKLPNIRTKFIYFYVNLDLQDVKVGPYHVAVSAD